VRFAKAHGLGNDFILVAESEAPPELASWTRALCDRHRGVGGDGIVLHAPAPDGVRMRLVNADGLEVEISGNGLRCLAALAVRRGWTSADHVVHTAVGPRRVEVRQRGRATYEIVTDLGPPVLRSEEIPVRLAPPRDRVVDHALEAAGGLVHVTATSMGNPHCAVFLDEPAGDDLVSRLGPALETHPFFPRRTNVEFVTVLASDAVRVRFWERGVGRTEASGTGAASAVVASIVTGRTGRAVRAVCDGGELEINWPEGGSVRQMGQAQIVFEGELLG
jgi:diaminopimelate epimerase